MENNEATVEAVEPQTFWDKAANHAQKAGKDVIENAVRLYYAAERPDTPIWAKTLIYSTLAYFILPVDAVPDAIPVAGFTDDLGALAAAVTTVAAHINQEVKDKAAAKLKDWFA